MRAALYCRISKDAEARGLGVARQEADCRALAERRDWSVADVYVDNDVAASRLQGQRRTRPEYGRLLEDIRESRVDAVIAWENDRLGRDPLEFEEFILLCEQVGLRHLVTVSGELDVTEGRGLLEARIKAAVAAEETRKLGQRLRRKHEELADRGRFHGGKRPYGYRSVGGGQLEVVPKEAVLIREAASRVLAGETLYGICGDFNRRGELSAAGAGWRTPTLRGILISGTVAGRRVYKGSDVGPATWEAILDEATSRALASALRRQSRAGRPPVNLLSGGLVVCSCGSNLYGQRRSNGRRTYICPVPSHPDKPGGCGGVSVTAEPLEEWVSEAVLIALDTPALADQAEQSATGGDTALRLLEARLDELTLMFTAGELDRRGLQLGRADLEAQIEGERRRLAQTARNRARAELPRGEELRAAWPSMTLSMKRSVLAAVLEHAVVNPTEKHGPTFSPERVELVWRA